MRGDFDGPTELILLPSLSAQRGPNGGLIMTRKYMEGAAEYARSWPGPVTSLVRLAAHPTTDMDHVEYMPGDAETGLEVRPDDLDALERRLSGAAQVVGFLARDEAAMLARCRKIGVPVVFVSEYSLRTERQILASDPVGALRRLRRHVWLWRTERIRRAMLRDASGLQCSGTPTYESYRGLNPNTILFFDNRVRTAGVISDEAMADKVAGIRRGRPLRLIFGGRLIAMKGVLELPRIAAELRKLGVPFTFDIYGSGPQQAELQALIQSLNLTNQMALRGVLDFHSGWVPCLQQSADIFICSHTQGDPSCTYPEVMSCGVPIAGYANDAFRGIVEVSGSGWQVPMFDARALAATLARLDKDRDAIADAALQARDFARQHVFEDTFAARVAHFMRSSRLPQGLRAEA